MTAHALQLPAPDRPQRRLLLAALAAMLAHAVLLFGIRTGALPQPAPTLEVTLALAASEPHRPSETRATRAQQGAGTGQRAQLAQSSGLIDSSGNAETVAASLPDRRAEPSPAPVPAVRMPRILSTRAASRPLPSGDERSGEQPPSRREQAGLGPREAEFNQLARAEGAADPALPVAASASADPRAAYLDSWRREVERLGSANFPWSALTLGGSGSLTLEVTMRADGSVAQARIRRSSGLPMLDQAALRILHLAAPFPPFPEELRQHDELRFAYDWEFLPGSRSSREAELRVGRP